MLEQKKKRFIVSYKDEKMDRTKAAKILGVGTKAMQEGVTFLGSEKELKETDILHFESLGTSIQSMSEEEAEIPALSR